VRRAVPALAVLALLAGCGGGGGTGSTRVTSDTLTIYTGLPLRGPRGPEGRAVLRGEKLALHDAGGHVNNLEIGLVALDDTDGSTLQWAPGQVAANAREAAQNPTTIAYIGDLDSGASAVSVPITELGKRLREFPKNRRVIAYCRGPYCVYADDAVRTMRKRGYRAARLEDGYPEWAAAGLPVSHSGGIGSP